MKANDRINPQNPAIESKPMKGADVVVEALIREGVDVIFAYPGGASLELHQALVKRSDRIRTILPRFEQGAGFMAHGYSRASGKAGVCMVTSGPGAANLVTCIADAFMDSIPLVAITGQVFQEYIGKAAFQETDVLDMTMPVVKHSYLVLTAEDLPRVIKEAFHIATTGRPGPVLVDIPKDVQQKVFVPDFSQEMDLPGYPPSPKAPDEELLKLIQLIENSHQPVLYTGGGIISSDASDDLRSFIQLTGVPQASTLMGLGAVDPDDELCLNWFGMHGSVAGNWAVYESDLLICAGARFDDRITGVVSKFAPNATIVHIDLDRSEHNKNKRAHLTIHSDVKYALARAIKLMREKGFRKPDLGEWVKRLCEWKAQYPFAFEPNRHVLAQEAIQALYEESKGDAIITTGVGQHQMWAAQFYRYKNPRTYISSLGLGTMGFGYPAALGAKVAFPDRQVIDIDGDGSFTMNIQELATAKMEKIPAKCMLLNNQHLGMVMQWEDRFYDGVRAQTILSDPSNIGSPENVGGLYPDFVKIADGFGVKGRRVIRREDLREGIREMLEHDGPYLLEVIVPYTEHVMPFIPQKCSAKEIIIK